MPTNMVTMERAKEVLISLADPTRTNPKDEDGCFYSWTEDQVGSDDPRIGKPACLAANALVALGLSLPTSADNTVSLFELRYWGFYSELSQEAADLLGDAQVYADGGDDWARAVQTALLNRAG